MSPMNSNLKVGLHLVRQVRNTSIAHLSNPLDGVDHQGQGAEAVFAEVLDILLLEQLIVGTNVLHHHTSNLQTDRRQALSVSNQV